MALFVTFFKKKYFVPFSIPKGSSCMHVHIHLHTYHVGFCYMLEVSLVGHWLLALHSANPRAHLSVPVLHPSLAIPSSEASVMTHRLTSVISLFEAGGQEGDVLHEIKYVIVEVVAVGLEGECLL